MITKSCKKVANDYECLICDYSTSRKSSYEKHLTTSKHISLHKSCKKVADINCYDNTIQDISNENQHTYDKCISLHESCKKVANEFECLVCEYYTSRKSSYEKHLTTSKHQKLQKNCKKLQKVAKNCNNVYTCNNCNKIYKSRYGLWNHKKNCNDNNININDKNIMNVILEVVKNNSDFQKQMFDFVKMQAVSNSNNTITQNMNCINNNNNNKTFNLQFFLNETCKDAMNITDFINSLQLELSDLESISKLGYVDGISKIIIKNLKALDENKRPIHCTDKKRESFYVKDHDKWEKEDENKSHIRKAIKYVANENTMLIPQWKAKYPDYMDSSSIQSDHYNNMIIEVLGGDDTDDVNENKIIRNIAKEVVINK